MVDADQKIAELEETVKRLEERIKELEAEAAEAWNQFDKYLESEYG